jgi:hypothetical protein
MEKDDHYGRYQEFNERYATKVIDKGKSDRRALKASLIAVFTLVVVISALVTMGYLYRKIKSKKLQDKAATGSQGKITPRSSFRRPIPSLGSKIMIVNQPLSITSPRLDLTR